MSVLAAKTVLVADKQATGEANVTTGTLVIPAATPVTTEAHRYC